MTLSILPASKASRFYVQWLNADPLNRQKLIDAVSDNTLSTQDFPMLLQNETLAGFTLARSMRRVRNLVLAHLIKRDLSGKADLSEVVATMTAFAEFAILAFTDHLMAEMVASHGMPVGGHSGEEQELIVIAMGKLGGEELNVSSDIDLIFVFPENGDTRPTGPGVRSLSNSEFFTRLGKRLIAALSEITEDGSVFRVDMALRPNGASGPLVSSFASLERYFLVQGREWERYAWIKARAVTGRKKDIEALDSIILPFVYRRYLDFGVIDAIRSMHRQIRAEVLRQEKSHPRRNINIKLGRGGIREIEFLVQMFQLIRGGRDPALRNRSTREILRILVDKRQIDADISDELLRTYIFLRELEHRLQYLDDAQTHVLPASPDDLVLIAKMMGFSDTTGFMEELDRHSTFVASQFDAIFSDRGTASSEEAQLDLNQMSPSAQPENEQLLMLEAKLDLLGFAHAQPAASRMLALFRSGRIRTLSDIGRARLHTAINLALPLVVESPTDQNRTLSGVLDFFESIAQRSAYLSLLAEYPVALDRLVRMIDASDWAAQYLTRHPILLDELLDVRMLLTEPDWPLFARELNHRLELERGDTEQQMDTLRNMHHTQLFRLLAQDLEGALTVERLADHLSDLADIIIEATVREAWLAMPNRHTDVPRFAVIAYGKPGGKELGYASDLDLIFLYDDAHESAPMLYARLVQRFITWMTTATSAGRLFEVDTALRPDGSSGLIVSSVDSFEKYQRSSAWTWEHQALTRARFCAGETGIGVRFEALRDEILRLSRDEGTLRQDVLDIREKLAVSQPAHPGIFDLKHDMGGMIDIEFLVQYLVLRHAGAFPELVRNAGNIALLHLCEKLGLIPPGSGQAVADIYRNFRKWQHMSRMQGEEVARVEMESVATDVATVTALWELVFGTARQAALPYHPTTGLP